MISPELSNGNMVLVTPKGALFANRIRSEGGNLAELGLSGTNNYNVIWRSGGAYGEQSWNADSDAIGTEVGVRTPDGIAIARGTKGCVISGPYASLQPGSYAVNLWFDPQTTFGGSTLDVCANEECDILKLMRADELGMDENGLVTFELAVASTLHNVEIRLHSVGDCEGRWIKLAIVPKRQWTRNVQDLFSATDPSSGGDHVRS
jgi:hypothetical protein